MEGARSSAERGVPGGARGAGKMIFVRIVFWVFLPALSRSAPPQETVSDAFLAPALVNPFSSSEENRRLLQSFINSNLKEEQSSPELNTKEQEVFFLFSLYDYDRSGQMDGLELMQLLTDFLTHHDLMPKSTDSVVSVVDYLLQNQDQNQDGLLAPSDLLSFTTEHQDGNNVVLPAGQMEDDLKAEETGEKPEEVDIQMHQPEAELKNEIETHDSKEQIKEKTEKQPDLPDAQQEQNKIHKEQPDI